MKGRKSKLVLACVLISVLGAAQAALGVSNDDCDRAHPIGDVTNLRFNTRGSTLDGPALCMASPNIWYCYTAPCTGEVTVSLLGSSYDTMLAVYDGCGCLRLPLMQSPATGI